MSYAVAPQMLFSLRQSGTLIIFSFSFLRSQSAKTKKIESESTMLPQAEGQTNVATA